MITNLQLKSKTIQAISKFVKESNNIDNFNIFIGWANDFRDGSTPANNANVTTASIPEQLVLDIYNYLLTLSYGLIYSNDITDFKNSIQSKRNGDPSFDAKCTTLENIFLSNQATIKSGGKSLLTGI